MEFSCQLDDLWESAFENLKVEALYDGARIAPWETVMHITGDASLFAHLETVYLGILARRSKIASNVRGVVDAANGKIVLYFPARFDHWAVQGGDGYAAHIGGANDRNVPGNKERFCRWLHPRPRERYWQFWSGGPECPGKRSLDGQTGRHHR